jgi:nucleoside phosphorylase
MEVGSRKSEVERQGGARLCVVTAVGVEFNAVAALLDAKTHSFEHEIKTCRGSVGKLQITLLQSEVGAPSFGRRLTAHLAAHEYDALLMIGLAGALRPRLRTGAVVVYDRCFEFDARLLTAPDFARKNPNVRDAAVPVRCDARLTDALIRACRAAGGECRADAGVTVDRMVVRAADKLALGEAVGASAVDMESYGVLTTAARLGVPAAVARVILDEAAADTPDFNRALTDNGRMKSAPLFAAMAARPVTSARFIRSLRPALKALRGAARAALGDEVWRAIVPAESGLKSGQVAAAQGLPPVDKSRGGD